jgi:hypothetical protein
MKNKNESIVGLMEMSLDDGYYVRPIDKNETHVWLLKIHYAKRIPPISYAFGLFESGEMVGVITYGQPASRSLCIGVAGEQNVNNVIELNRLALKYNRKNEASRLIGQSLRMIAGPKVVVSYADTEQSHLGVVYQATNWLYTGITVARTEWTVRGLEHLHTKALSNKFESLEEIQQHYGDDFYYRPRSQKHRYVKLLGNKTERKTLLSDLKYPILLYPKTEKQKEI